MSRSRSRSVFFFQTPIPCKQVSRNVAKSLEIRAPSRANPLESFPGPVWALSERVHAKNEKRPAAVLARVDLGRRWCAAVAAATVTATATALLLLLLLLLRAAAVTLRC